jgi:type I restriction enzyme S subunit
MWLNFGELISEGPQNGLYKPASCYGQGTLIVRIDNFYDGKLNSWKTFKRLQIDENELNIYHLDQGDILINRVNSMTYIGKCSLVNNIPESCVFESNIMRIKISYRSCNSQFLIYYLSSCRGLKELRKNAKQAVNQASINQQDVTLSLIPICSMQEQTQIVQEIESRLSVCDQLEATLTENLDKAEALRQSILKRAFEGKLVL